MSYKLRCGLAKIVFCHPEAVLSEEGRRLMKSDIYQNNVVACVVDEAHCIDMWGKEFRTEFSQLSSLRSFSPRVPFLCLTATAPPPTIQKLVDNLCLKNHVIVKANPNRKNVYLNKNYRFDKLYGFKSYEEILLPLAEALKIEKKKYERGRCMFSTEKCSCLLQELLATNG